ncbi:MAG TPA: helix-turn-helix transcriptional regulator [Stellaceae bacterium]|nr:helix-turn-helix transcriptional regulator [Stellaceae bacterium]
MSGNTEDEGTDNGLANLGFPNAEELTAKAILAKKINDILDVRRLAQSDAAKLLDLPQPKVSAIHHYKLRGISLERLMLALTALGQRVEIIVSPSCAEAPPRIEVAARDTIVSMRLAAFRQRSGRSGAGLGFCHWTGAGSDTTQAVRSTL